MEVLLYYCYQQLKRAPLASETTDCTLLNNLGFMCVWFRHMLFRDRQLPESWVRVDPKQQKFSMTFSKSICLFKTGVCLSRNRTQKIGQSFVNRDKLDPLNNHSSVVQAFLWFFLDCDRAQFWPTELFATLKRLWSTHQKMHCCQHA